MVRTALEAREQILADLATATDQLALATACLEGAYDQLDELTADRLDEELVRPVRKAFGRAKRSYSQFAGRFGLPSRGFEPPPPGVRSQGVARFVDRAVSASEEAGRTIAGLQDSMLPIEAGDPELRAGLAEIRELVDEVPARARRFIQTRGR
jgi:hypothetical protein